MSWSSADPACAGDDIAERALGLVTPGVTPSPLDATVDVQHEGANWVVRLETESGEQKGERVLRAESCEELRQAIALLLAMTLEARGALPGSPEPPVPPEARPEPPPPPPPPPAVPPESLPEDVDPAPAAEVTGMRVGGYVRTGALAGVGLQPGLAWGVSAGAGLRLEAIDVGVEAQHWPETRERLPAPGTDAVVAVQRQTLGLRACWNVLRAGAFVVAPCLAPRLTLFAYDSFGLAEKSNRRVRPLGSLGAAADARYELFGGLFSVRVSAGIDIERKQPFEITLRQPSTPPDETGQMPGSPPLTPPVRIYETAGLGPRLEIGVDARF